MCCYLFTYSLKLRILPQCQYIYLIDCDHSIQQDEDKALKINWRRVATTSLFGFGFVGPVGHFWLVNLLSFRNNLLKLVSFLLVCELWYELLKD